MGVNHIAKIAISLEDKDIKELKVIIIDKDKGSEIFEG